MLRFSPVSVVVLSLAVGSAWAQQLPPAPTGAPSALPPAPTTALPPAPTTLPPTAPPVATAPAAVGAPVIAPATAPASAPANTPVATPVTTQAASPAPTPATEPTVAAQPAQPAKIKVPGLETGIGELQTAIGTRSWSYDPSTEADIVNLFSQWPMSLDAHVRAGGKIRKGMASIAYHGEGFLRIPQPGQYQFFATIDHPGYDHVIVDHAHFRGACVEAIELSGHTILHVLAKQTRNFLDEPMVKSASTAIDLPQAGDYQIAVTIGCLQVADPAARMLGYIPGRTVSKMQASDWIERGNRQARFTLEIRDPGSRTAKPITADALYHLENPPVAPAPRQVKSTPASTGKPAGKVTAKPAEKPVAPPSPKKPRKAASDAGGLVIQFGR